MYNSNGRSTHCAIQNSDLLQTTARLQWPRPTCVPVDRGRAPELFLFSFVRLSASRSRLKNSYTKRSSFEPRKTRRERVFSEIRIYVHCTAVVENLLCADPRETNLQSRSLDGVTGNTYGHSFTRPIQSNMMTRDEKDIRAPLRKHLKHGVCAYRRSVLTVWNELFFFSFPARGCTDPTTGTLPVQGLFDRNLGWVSYWHIIILCMNRYAYDRPKILRVPKQPA